MASERLELPTQGLGRPSSIHLSYEAILGQLSQGILPRLFVGVKRRERILDEVERCESRTLEKLFDGFC